MKLCVVSFKECWRDAAGAWVSDGGFPRQMAMIASLFDETTFVVVAGRARAGGMPLPPAARVVALRRPAGVDLRRKLSVLVGAPHYLAGIAREVQRADVVHTPLPGDIAFLGMLVALAMRKRLIARFGGSWVPNAHTTAMDGLTRWLMRRTAGGRNVMIATGEGGAAPADGVNWLFATAVSTSELAAPLTPLEEAALPDEAERPLRVACIGRLSPEKGVDVLIRAVGRLAADGLRPLPEAVVVGDGPARPSLEQLARRCGCADRITFTGQLDRRALAAELHRVRVCVQPSRTESLCKAWLDAMAFGRPVIASDVGVARTVLGRDGERGWLVPPDDAEALARMLQRLTAEPPDWAALALRCRAYVRERTLEHWAARIGALCAAQWGGALVDGRVRL